MAMKVVQLKNNAAYQKWIEENGEKFEIVNIQSSPIRWNAWTGFVGAALKKDSSYVLTVREKAEVKR